MDYIEQKQLLLTKILQNTQTQTYAIENEDLQTLDTLINQRDSLIQQVDNLDRAMASTVSNISKGDFQPIKDLLTQIIQIDNANQALMNKEFEHIKSELRKIRIGKQQEQNYRNEYGIYREEGVFFDTK